MTGILLTDSHQNCEAQMKSTLRFSSSCSPHLLRQSSATMVLFSTAAAGEVEASFFRRVLSFCKQHKVFCCTKQESRQNIFKRRSRPGFCTVSGVTTPCAVMA